MCCEYLCFFLASVLLSIRCAGRPDPPNPRTLWEVSATERLVGTVVRVLPLKADASRALLLGTIFEGKRELVKGLSEIGIFRVRHSVLLEAALGHRPSRSP